MMRSFIPASFSMTAEAASARSFSRLSFSSSRSRLFEQSIVGFYRIRAAASHETSHAVILKSEFAGDGFQRFGRRFVQPDRFGVFFRTAAQDRFPVVQICLAE